MTRAKGQDSGHATQLDAYGWAELVVAHRDAVGGWVNLASALREKAGKGIGSPNSVEKGLKRLESNPPPDGGKYGRLLLKHFGVPPSMLEWARLMGQYHSRFADLSVTLRRQQLLRWDRQPIKGTKAEIWIHVGLASVAHRAGDTDELRDRLEQAQDLKKPDPAGLLELDLLLARVHSDARELDLEASAIERASRRLANAELRPADLASYRARLCDQRAYQASRDWRNDPSCLARAATIYEKIDIEPLFDFPMFRRNHGLAWCRWRMGERERALDHSEAAVRHAGDGGLIRFRVMALKLQGVILGAPGRGILERALRLARGIDDPELVRGLEDQLAKLNES